MTLRVAHVLNSPGRGGVPHVAAALIRQADPARISPHLFYLKDGAAPDLAAGLNIPCGRGSGGKSGAMLALVNWLGAHSIDILHTHSYRPNLYGRMAGAVLRPDGLRIVAHYHNDYSDKWRDPAILAAERRLAAVTDAAVAVSDAVARQVAEAVPGLPALEVIENGVDRARLAAAGARAQTRSELGLEPGQTVVGLVGRVCHQKGVDVFVEAALALVARYPEARFLVVGDLEDRALHARLSEEISTAGQHHVIRFTGYREDMGAVFAALDVVAAPSRWEGFGLVLAEAMAAGVPVVASRVGCIPSVVGNAARLVPSEDPAALAAEIGALLADPKARATLVRAGRIRAERFDWSRAAACLDALYHRIAGRN